MQVLSRMLGHLSLFYPLLKSEDRAGWVAGVLPRRDGIVHAGSGARAVAIKFLSSLAVAAAVV